MSARAIPQQPRPGVILLAHIALDRVAQVARFWAEGGLPVEIHIDRRVPAPEFEGLKAALADLPEVGFTRRLRCEWGRWSIVQAMQDAASALLARSPVTHVLTTSGSCLPLRPIGDLIGYLARHPETDFIESVSVEDVNWTKGGLSHERFTLFFPVGFKSSKRIFDRLVDLQRALGVEREMPGGVEAHMGSQWWCLTRSTLTAILEDPERKAFDRFFKSVWIPDESYFQTLARLHSPKIEGRSLTLSRFDHQGKPHIFYDDHLQLLRRSDCFIARKIWHGANRLYGHFLAPRPGSEAEPQPARVDRHFARATEQRLRGRPGLYNVSRFPQKEHENGKTAAPYSVFHGLDDLYPDFPRWLASLGGNRVHGHLFGPLRAEFAGGERDFAGGLSDSASLRDYNRQAFLTNLLWATRGERQCFQFGPADLVAQKLDLLWFMAGDSNAQITVITGAWAVPLSRSGAERKSIRRQAAQLQRIEMQMLETLRSPWTRARVRIWSMAEFLDNPSAMLQPVLSEIIPHGVTRSLQLPEAEDLTGFGSFLQSLRNQGMQPVLMGDFPIGAALPDPAHRMK